MKICVIDGCGKKHEAKGLCNAHYKLEWQRQHPESRKKTAVKYYTYHKDDVLARTKCWRAENPESQRRRSKRWSANHPDYQKAYEKQKYRTDGNYRLSKNLRNRLIEALKSQNATKTSSAVRGLGCTIPELREYLESNFRSGMSWENHGQWHIDHIRPLASFDLTDPEQQKQACHFTNLQPLWAAENLVKGDRFVYGQI